MISIYTDEDYIRNAYTHNKKFIFELFFINIFIYMLRKSKLYDVSLVASSGLTFHTQEYIYFHAGILYILNFSFVLYFDNALYHLV